MTAPRLKWGVERRLEFIEFRLYWDGSVNRADLMDMFDVSVPQASKDFALYQERAPGNAVYDTRSKRYVAGPDFAPRFMTAGADEYLARLKGLIEGDVDPARSWIREPPPAAVVPTPTRALKPEILRALLKAIRDGEAVEIVYVSFSRAEPTPRWIAPHALGYDGARWHVRAFDELRDDFVDFVIGRILDVRGRRPSEVRAADDAAWRDTETLVIAPNPALPETQRNAIAIDYDMADGAKAIEVRRAFGFYARQRLGLGPGHRDRRPEDQHIVLVEER
jgi:predicted DNA-binding transcriptional regulator YafY